MREFIIKEDLVNKILNNLARRPYTEVATLIGEIEKGIALVAEDKDPDVDEEEQGG